MRHGAARAHLAIVAIAVVAVVNAGGYTQRLGGLMAQKAPPKETPEADASGSPPCLPAAEPKRPAAPRPPRREERPMTCRNLTKGNLVVSHLELATTPATRRKGLLGRSGLPRGGGLLLVPCRSVHTVGMKFAIDIVFIDKQMRVARILHSVKPGAVHRQCLKAHSTLELPAGAAAEKRLEVGDQLRTTKTSRTGGSN